MTTARRPHSRIPARRNQGFTLIELLIVMIIIAILMAVAIPIFLGQKEKAVATNAKTLAMHVSKQMDSCLASTGTGGLADEDGTLVCTQKWVRDTEPGLRSKACRDLDDPVNPEFNLHSTRNNDPHECFAVFPARFRENEAYIVVVRTEPIHGANYGYFVIYKTQSNSMKICGAADTDGTWTRAPINWRTGPPGYVNVFTGTGDPDTVKRICPTGWWGPRVDPNDLF